MIGTILISQAALAAPPPSLPEGEALASLTVLADREIAIPLNRLLSDYSRLNHGSMSAQFAPPEQLIQAIEEGEAADLYITSYPGIIDSLKERGLAEIADLPPLGQERLVLAASRGWWQAQGPTDWPPSIDKRSSLPALLRRLPETRLVLPEPGRSASGRIAYDMLRRQHWQVPLAAYTIFAPNTAASLSRLQQPGLIGFAYASDVAARPELVIISTVSPRLQSAVPLEAAIIAGERMKQARELLVYLQKSWAGIRK